MYLMYMFSTLVLAILSSIFLITLAQYYNSNAMLLSAANVYSISALRFSSSPRSFPSIISSASLSNSSSRSLCLSIYACSREEREPCSSLSFLDSSRAQRVLREDQKVRAEECLQDRKIEISSSKVWRSVEDYRSGRMV